jgi:hypothetical protein
MGIIGYTSTKKQAITLKKKQKFHKDIKIEPITAAFGKIVRYEVTGTPKRIFDETKIIGNRKIITSYVRHRGRKVRISSSEFKIN